MASSCIACCIFHIINIAFNRSDTALYKSSRSYDRSKVIILCFAMFPLFLEFGARTRPQDLWPFLISDTGLEFLI